MWARMRLDISWSDLAYGLWHCLRLGGRRITSSDVEQRWSDEDDSLTCLSVRSGFDLILGTLKLPARSEVLITAITIPDIVNVLERHGLVPVPVDMYESDFTLDIGALHRAITSATRAIIVTHLFGGHACIEPIIQLARQHQLAVIEDCAQAYIGPNYRGHPSALAAMFSFGTIKTATALGGALISVSDSNLLSAMRQRHSAYPRQSRGTYMCRLLKYAMLKFLSIRPVFTAMIHAFRVLGLDYNRVINNSARGFSGADLIRQIRRQPSAPLLGLLERRLRRFNPAQLRRRTSQANRLAKLIGPQTVRPGADMANHSHWVFPVLAIEPDSLIAALAASGFDATRGERLCVVNPPQDRHELEPTVARTILAQSVFLPCCSGMSESALKKMAEIVVDHSVMSHTDSPRLHSRATEDGDQRDPLPTRSRGVSRQDSDHTAVCDVGDEDCPTLKVSPTRR